MKQPSHATAVQANPVKPIQAESNQIKPNQTCGAVGVSRNWTIRWGKNSAEVSPVKLDQTQSNWIKPNQTGSNPIKLDQSKSNRVKASQTGSKQVKLRDSQESEQIGIGLCGLLARPFRLDEEDFEAEHGLAAPWR
jgi:hypothetical protein